MMKSIKRILDFQKLKEKGFTLIEMLVVVTIIGLLVAVIMPRFTGQVDTARKEKFNSAVFMIEQQAEIFYYKYGSYPDGEVKPSNEKWKSAEVFATYFKGGTAPKNPYHDIDTSEAEHYSLDTDGKVTTEIPTD